MPKLGPGYGPELFCKTAEKEGEQHAFIYHNEKLLSTVSRIVWTTVNSYFELLYRLKYWKMKASQRTHQSRAAKLKLPTYFYLAHQDMAILVITTQVTYKTKNIS